MHMCMHAHETAQKIIDCDVIWCKELEQQHDEKNSMHLVVDVLLKNVDIICGTSNESCYQIEMIANEMRDTLSHAHLIMFQCRSPSRLSSWSSSPRYETYFWFFPSVAIHPLQYSHNMCVLMIIVWM